MDIWAHASNIREAWQTTSGISDFAKTLLWVYEEKLFSGGRTLDINFRLPPPMGDLNLRVRENSGSDRFIFGEVFHHQYYRLPTKPKAETVLDLGANAGFTAVYFAKLYPEASIACVEPVPGNVSILETNITLNSLTSRLEVFPNAIGLDDESTLLIALDENDYGHRTLSPEQSASDTLSVNSISVPSIMKKMKWERISLLKVDIEGYEKTLFSKDCDWLDLVDTLCIECHEDFGEQDLINIANQYGFAPPKQLPGVWLLDEK